MRPFLLSEIAANPRASDLSVQKQKFFCDAGCCVQYILVVIF